MKATSTKRDLQCWRQSDPNVNDAWWWLGVPVAIAGLLFALTLWAPAFYVQEMQPEHTGWLERAHFVLPLCAGLLFLRSAANDAVAAIRLLRPALILLAAAAIYWALEEESYGQHFFQWDTPDPWSAINKQNETNLHNTSWWLAQLPRSLLIGGIIGGGLILPLVRCAIGGLRPEALDFLTPPLAIIPSALAVLIWKAFDDVAALNAIVRWPDGYRPGEANETFYAVFLLVYAVMISRRCAALTRGAA